MDKEVLLALVKLTTAQTEFINTVVKLLGEPKKEIPKPIMVEPVTVKGEEEIPLTPTVEESPTTPTVEESPTLSTDDEFKPYLPGDTYKLGHKLHTMLKQAKDEKFGCIPLASVWKDRRLDGKIDYSQLASYFNGRLVPVREDILIMLEDLTGIPAELLKKASDEDRVWRKRRMK